MGHVILVELVSGLGLLHFGRLRRLLFSILRHFTSPYIISWLVTYFFALQQTTAFLPSFHYITALRVTAKPWLRSASNRPPHSAPAKRGAAEGWALVCAVGGNR